MTRSSRFASFLPETLLRLNIDVDGMWSIATSSLSLYLYIFFVRLIRLIKRAAWGGTVVHLAGSLITMCCMGMFLALSATTGSSTDKEQAYFLGVIVLIAIAATVFSNKRWTTCDLTRRST